MILVDKNNEAKQEHSPCDSSIYIWGINSEKEEEEKNVDVVVATKKRPTWDADFVKRAWGKCLSAC